MNYYDQLYDINFFSNDSYIATVNDSSIIIRSPGVPDWSTWRSNRFSADDAKEIWLDYKKNKIDLFKPQLFNKSLEFEDSHLLTLLLCEDAYRMRDPDSFFSLNRILSTSMFEDLRLKAIKLQYGWFALSCLGTGGRYPLRKIVSHCLNYMQKELRLPGITEEEIKVELPVKKDWEEKSVSYSDREAIESFYKSTYSYILELTAANHQVETLFNYCIVIELIKRLGVRDVMDYGAGIGSFIFLSQYYDIRGTYMDLDSLTMQYFVERSKTLGIDVPFSKINPDKIKIPDGLDCIICTEVLEHIFDPEELIQSFYDSLPRSGILVISESFDYVDKFCCHLPQHKGKGGEKFLTYLNKVGFRQIPLNYYIHPTVHIKI